MRAFALRPRPPVYPARLPARRPFVTRSSGRPVVAHALRPRRAKEDRGRLLEQWERGGLGGGAPVLPPSHLPNSTPPPSTKEKNPPRVGATCDWAVRVPVLTARGP